MDRLFTRRGVMIGAGAMVIAPVVPAMDSLAVAPAIIPAPLLPRPIRGFFVGTGQHPLGAAVDLSFSDGTVSLDVNPMTHKGDAGPIVSSDPFVRVFLLELAERLRAESYQNRAITAQLKTKRDPNLRGEWINCPSCLGLDSDDCTTCYGRGCVWRSF